MLVQNYFPTRIVHNLIDICGTKWRALDGYSFMKHLCGAIITFTFRELAYYNHSEETQILQFKWTYRFFVERVYCYISALIQQLVAGNESYNTEGSTLKARLVLIVRSL